MATEKYLNLDTLSELKAYINAKENDTLLERNYHINKLSQEIDNLKAAVASLSVETRQLADAFKVFQEWSLPQEEKKEDLFLFERGVWSAPTDSEIDALFRRD